MYIVIAGNRDDYRVVEEDDYEEEGVLCHTIFLGSLADCEAWIRLRQSGLLR